MTSWIHVQPKKLVEQEKSFFFETFDSDAYSNFNQYLYAYVYSVAEGRPLQIYDKSNNISMRYPLIQGAFSDMSGVVYRDSMPATASNTAKILPRIIAHVRAQPVQALRDTAQTLFQWNPTLVNSIRESIAKVKLPGEMDLGVNLRVANEARASSVDEIVRAVKKFQTASKKSTLNIFVMKDNAARMTEFAKKAEASWTLYTLPMPLTDAGQRQTSRSAERDRLAMHTYAMSELFLIQNIPDIICSFASSIGQFLYMTVAEPQRIISLGVPKFAILL
jgi:hypothetical protein